MRGGVRWSVRGLVLVVVVAVGLWGFQQGQQWLLRWRAERLLGEIQALNVSHSDGAEAEAIGARWKKWDSPSQKCTRNDCQHRIVMEVHIPSYFGFDYEHPGKPQPFMRVFDRLGLRPSAVIADIRVRHGVITNKGFGVDIARPVRFWENPEGGFETEVKAYDREGANLVHTLDSYSGNMNFNVITEPHGTLEAESTPQEPLKHRRMLMEFRLDCITRWSPCLTNAELNPEAGADLAAQSGTQEMMKPTGQYVDAEHGDCAGRKLEFIARQSDEVWIVTAEVRREPETYSRIVEDIPYVIPQQIMKGKSWAPPGVPIVTTGYNDAFSASAFGKMDRLFVFGYKDIFSFVIPEFRADACSFTRVTPEKLLDVKRGVAEDFDSD